MHLCEYCDRPVSVIPCPCLQLGVASEVISAYGAGAAATPRAQLTTVINQRRSHPVPPPRMPAPAPPAVTGPAHTLDGVTPIHPPVPA